MVSSARRALRPPRLNRDSTIYAAYKDFFHHVDRPMRFMSEELRLGKHRPRSFGARPQRPVHLRLRTEVEALERARGWQLPEQGREPPGDAERAAVPGATEKETGDALRRTRLANERTYLAWWRTGMTAFAVSLGVGKLIPELSKGPAWPFELVGAAFGVVGIALMAYAYVRQKEVEEALARDDYARFDPRASLVFAVIGVTLGIGTLLIILVESH